MHKRSPACMLFFMALHAQERVHGTEAKKESYCKGSSWNCNLHASERKIKGHWPENLRSLMLPCSLFPVSIGKHSMCTQGLTCIHWRSSICAQCFISVVVHSGGCPPSLLLPVCILLDVGWGYHAVSAGSTGVWNSSWEVVLPPNTGMG